MASDNKTVTWVIDPTFVYTRDKHLEIVDLLEQSYISKSVDYLDQNIYRFTYVGDFKRDYEYIKIALSNIELEPTTLTLIVDDENSTSIIDGATSLVKAYTEKILKTKVRRVNVDIQKSSPVKCIFTPQLITGESIYRLPEIQEAFGRICDLNELYGLQVLSSDPLILEALYQTKLIDRKGLKLHHGIMLYPVERNVYWNTTYSDVLTNELGSPNAEKTRLLEYTKKLRLDGNLMFPSDLEQRFEIDLSSNIYPELARMVDYDMRSDGIREDDAKRGYDARDGKERGEERIERVEGRYFPFPNHCLIKGSNDLDEHWFNKSIEYIKNGSIPRFEVSNEIEFGYNVFGGDLKMKLYYAAIKAYYSLMINHPILAPFIVDIQILDNLTISIPAVTNLQIDEFNNLLENEKKIWSSWEVIPCNGLLDGLVMRWLYSNKYNVNPLILSDGKGKESVVVNFSPSDAPYTFSEEEYNEAYSSLLYNAIQTYNSCTKSKIFTKNLDLDFIINSPEFQTSIMNCFMTYTKGGADPNNLLDKEYLNNPNSNVTHLDLKFFQWGLRGLYPLVGFVTTQNDKSSLLREYPSRLLVPPPRGPTEEILVLEGETGLYSIELNRGITSISLFDISLIGDVNVGNDVQLGREISKTVTELWNKGWFLSPWATAVAIYLKQPSLAIGPYPDILIQASNSTSDGKKALEYLNGVNSELK